MVAKSLMVHGLALKDLMFYCILQEMVGKERGGDWIYSFWVNIKTEDGTI
jgi:hypothetical protein